MYSEISKTMLAHAQELVYSLKELMPTQYQKDNLEAILGLFLEVQGHSLPEHSQTKSPSALSRFFNINAWSTRNMIRVIRKYILQTVLKKISFTLKWWGKRRWQIEGWFKTAKHRFGLHRFGESALREGFPLQATANPKGQGTLLGMYRWLILSLTTYLIAHWTYLSTQLPIPPDWGQAAQTARESIFPQIVVSLLLHDIERLSLLALSCGFDICFSRCKM